MPCPRIASLWSAHTEPCLGSLQSNRPGSLMKPFFYACKNVTHIIFSLVSESYNSPLVEICDCVLCNPHYLGLDVF
eukprot:XP_001706410.1 Hypothetical protein GL50803_37959 [Giardia lamblia ATCC 50803]